MSIRFRLTSLLYTLCLKIVYYAVIYPNIISRTSIWTGTYKSTINPAFIAQKGINRAFLGVTQRTTSGCLFQELGVLGLRDFLKNEKITYVFKSLNSSNLDEFSLQQYETNEPTSNMSS